MTTTGSNEQVRFDPAIAYEMPTNSQIEQERWVFAMCNGRRDGRFAEIGAFDGVLHSNSYFLESEHGWQGVCVEPNPALFARLNQNRSAICLERAVYRETGQILSFIPSQEIGTLAEFAGNDRYADDRARAAATHGLIQVETISFAAIAEMADFAETGFDYVSLDTEGSELEILRTIDFARHRIALFTIEHNFVEPRREEMRMLLAEAGYDRLNVGFDDWYWHPAFLIERNRGVAVDAGAISRHFKSIFKD
ncbi:FkbM family methyltransferase [Bosea sp. (in: a-proteobacteria)]|jgi:FkbM family methyltransferase|uniref:FkbM family methyltransferase n=1 Tax=Bosea sp. (in: a-proteobacteria) TaxID=1871050 RepID=UPI002DDD4E4A|nr:FkbM family methyltransferase [Bosea sp. (in: a-proteobacteria)]HEV2512216.1 FkbM family methyltransferase [Bosea sp. (in: a-proteobacteria)]